MKQKLFFTGTINDVSKQLGALVEKYGKDNEVSWVGTLERLDRAFVGLINGIKGIVR